jgi:arginyl-tRNA synthetase
MTLPQSKQDLSILEFLQRRVSDAFANAGLPREFGEISVSSRAQKSDFQCNGALAAAKEQKGRNPRDIAEKIAASLKDIAKFADVEVAGPGFINFRLNSDALSERLNSLSNDPRHGHEKAARPKHIIVDYGGPNAAKAMHVGHLRSAVIGQSLKYILRFQGHQVIGDIHMGDWGLQMGQLITELARMRPDLPYFDSAYYGPFPKEPPCTMEDLLSIYPKASARSKEDPKAREEARQATAELQAGRAGYRALWQHFVDVSIEDIRGDYRRLGVSFEQWFGESRYQERLVGLIGRLESQGIAIEDDSLLVVPLDSAGGRELPPLILRNSDGGVGYGATDLATIDERANSFHSTHVFYVVDARQGLHFEQVFNAAYKSGVAPDHLVLEHLAFGTVNGADGKPFKTREGGIMRLADLMDMLISEARKRLDEVGTTGRLGDSEVKDTAEIVGLGALKFGELQHDRMSDYMFDLTKFSRFEGKTGPYIQYTCVRIKNLLLKSRENGMWNERILIESEIEKRIALNLDQFGGVIDRTAEFRKPHLLAEHLYELASSFNQLYTDHKILIEPDRERAGSLLALCELVLGQLVLGLELLGIAVPERM